MMTMHWFARDDRKLWSVGFARCPGRRVWTAVALVWAAMFSGTAAGDDERIDFEKNVRPLLRERCVTCHGPERQSGGLRLDARHFAFQGGDGGQVLVAGASSDSELVRRITSDDDAERMPPEGEPLDADQVAAIARWIDQGAEWPETQYDRDALHDPRRDHWAFQALPAVTVPDVSDMATTPPRTAVDPFIIQKLAERGLTLSPEADPRTLIRRLALDLTGLPPTPERVAQFVADTDPLAYEKLVDELLASPRYGERWAQHWLDIVRYADTHGFEVNTPREHAWPYRDYVIRSFNEDKPYDRFVLEQLAGDAFEADAATGLLVASAVLLPGQIGQDDASKRAARQDALDEIIVGTSSTLLGLTIGCARCHDHKFDPISQRDYYAMQAFFAGVEYGDRVIEDATTAENRKRAAALETEIRQLEFELRTHEPLAAVQLDPNGGAAVVRRASVNPRINRERFAPIAARFVRFTTLATIDNNRHEPCIDELEIYGPEDPGKNLALSVHGSSATSSGNYSDSGSHQLKHINDGAYGNERSWISNQFGGGWVQIELPGVFEVDYIQWGRDREGKYQDRLPVQYVIEVSVDGQQWTAVADHTDRVPLGVEWPEGERPEVTREIVERLRKIEAERERLLAPPVVFAGTFRSPDPTFLLRRGDAEQRVAEVAPAVPEVFEVELSGDMSMEQERRLALARWVASPDNPLTARVIVNRLWLYHFGQGLVDTPNDFGLNGSRPTHPELLDWLAGELIRSGWSLKHIHRQIVLSATYRQSNQIVSQGIDRDPDNRYYWRFAARRLEAEAIRDSMLSVSDSLNLAMGGPGFDFFGTRGGLDGFPPIEQFGPEGLRRMIYSHKVRMETVPVFGAFDCPDAGQSVPRRSRSTTALQALNLMNSRFVIEQSERLAQRASRDVGTEPMAQIERAFLLVYGRLPTEVEVRAAARVVEDHGLSTLCRALLNSNEFLFLP